MNPFNTEPERPVEEILRDIEQGAKLTSTSPQGAAAVGTILAPFAALLVRLSRDAEKSASKLNRITGKLICLTWILVVMTGIIIVLTIPIVGIETYKFFREVFQNQTDLPQNNEHAGQQDQQTNTAKKTNDGNPSGSAVSSESGGAPTQKKE